ncbi:MAG: hypothetical protein HY903_02860 [Deltaproteobacteria bacterium]|nr:hypothetical protein [Deltaproteobacteria bacterium]
MVFAEAAGPQVLMAHESEEVSGEMGSVLLHAGFSPLRAANGCDAIKIIDARRPVAAVLDVGLGDVMSFQVIEHVRGNEALRGTKVVLVASVFNSAAYKRRPKSLYGADDYVEQHHIPDLLPGKLGALLHVSAGRDDADIDTRRAKIHDGETRRDLSGEERVVALARSIVADIALYNEAEVKAYRRTRQSEPLQRALDEGRRLLLEAGVGSVPAGSDPIREAFAQLVAEMETRRR